MNIANLHVMMSVNNCDFYEFLVPPDMLQYGMTRDVAIDREGYVHGPSAPGIGFEIDMELLARTKVDELK